MASDGEGLRTTGIGILATLAVIAALYFGADFIVPIVFAIILAALLRPVVRALKRLHMPAMLASALAVLGLIGLMVAAGFSLAGPVRAWAAKAPQTFEAAQGRIERFREPVRKVTNAAEQLKHVAELSPATAQSTTVPSSAPSSSDLASSEPAAPQPVQPTMSASRTTPTSVLARVLGSTTQIVGETVEVLLLLFLILAADGMFLR